MLLKIQLCVSISTAQHVIPSMARDQVYFHVHFILVNNYHCRKDVAGTSETLSLCFHCLFLGSDLVQKAQKNHPNLHVPRLNLVTSLTMPWICQRQISMIKLSPIIKSGGKNLKNEEWVTKCTLSMGAALPQVGENTQPPCCLHGLLLIFPVSDITTSYTALILCSVLSQPFRCINSLILRISQLTNWGREFTDMPKAPTVTELNKAFKFYFVLIFLLSLAQPSLKNAGKIKG